MSQRYQGGILGVGFNPLQAPNAPTIGTATAGVGSASVAFTAPANVGGSAISSYRVLANPGGIGATTASSPVTFSGLTNGTTYTFSVAAVNSYGFSPYSGTATATPSQMFVEDVFSTWLYTGNGSTQTITNGINLSGQGGLVWAKSRVVANSHILTDTARGVANTLATNFNGAQNALETNALSSFNSNGFTLNNSVRINASGESTVSWTFREAPNFFDVVTYTGNGANRNIAHNLGSVPGMILVKRTDTTADWQVYHRSNANTQYMVLNDTAAVATGATRWNSTTPTATEFSVGTDATVNASGGTYVAYLFAHNTASDGLIQCGSYAGTGVAGQIATLGWEPQWVMIKATNTATDWQMYDTMRGMTTLSDGTVRLNANTSGAESGPFGGATSIFPTATGFGAGGGIEGANQGGGNYIYVAIRRGPMKTPTLGTSVFSPVAYSGTGSGATQLISTSFPVDAYINRRRASTDPNFAGTRLTSSSTYLTTNTINSATNLGGGNGTNNSIGFASNVGLGVAGDWNDTSVAYIDWAFRRAPGFMDVVCYTGTGVVRTVNHNLGVAPELLIIKTRSDTNSWYVGTQFAASTFTELVLTSGAGFPLFPYDNLFNAQPTSTTFSVGTSGGTNGSGSTYVAYLFASAPGVSKVGSYTGNGSSQTINCAFTTGARFVMIKRTDSTGDWYVWDSARGIVAGNDPYLALNTTAAEVTSDDSVDTDSTGFVVNQVAASNVNVNAATYIFLAIA